MACFRPNEAENDETMDADESSPAQVPSEQGQGTPMSMSDLIKSGELTEMFQRGVDEAIADHIAHGLPASGRLTQDEFDALQRKKAKPL